MDISPTPDTLDALIASWFITSINEDESFDLSTCGHTNNTPHFEPDWLFAAYQNTTTCKSISIEWNDTTYEDYNENICYTHQMLTKMIACLSPALKRALKETYGDFLYPNYNPIAYLKFQSDIHNRLHLNEIQEKNFATPCTTDGKDWIIPPINHHIYLAKPGISTQEMEDKDLQNLFQKLSLLDSEDPGVWQHILWTNCKDCMPQTIQQLNTFIEIRELKDYAVNIPELSFIESMHAKNFMELAVNTLKISLLKAYGGFYSDLNYELFQSPAPYMKSHDFMAQIEMILNGYLEDYLLASTQSHPITHDIFKYIFQFIQNIEKYKYNIEQLNEEITTNFLSLISLERAIVTQWDNTNFCGLPYRASYVMEPYNDKKIVLPIENADHPQNEVLKHYCYTHEALGHDRLDNDEKLSWL